MARLPLEGVRIVDLGIIWAGPFATMILADMGAEVIVVESIQHFNATRGTQPRPPASSMGALAGAYYVDRDPTGKPYNRQSTFNFGSRGKLGMTVDLNRPEGKKIFLDLVKVSDIMMENGAGGTMEKLGLTYDVLREANPQIIMLRFPGYGNSGPYQFYKGYGNNVECLVGHTWLRGYPDLDPSATPAVYHADPAAGASAAFAVMAALYYRKRTGKGQFIDMAQGENVINHLSQAMMDYSMNQRVQGTLGNRDPSMAPQGAYRCRGEDQWAVLSVENDEQFAALCKVMGRPELAEDPRFADAISRYCHQDELDSIIAEWMRDRDQYEVMHTLQGVGIPAGAVLNHETIWADPHLRARDFFVRLTHAEAGTHEYPGIMFKFENNPLYVRRPAPGLGEHNEHVYKRILKYSNEEYKRLIEEEHVGWDYLPNARI